MDESFNGLSAARSDAVSKAGPVLFFEIKDEFPHLRVEKSLEAGRIRRSVNRGK